MALQDEAPLFDGASSQREVLLYAALASHWLAPPKDAIDTLVLGAADASALAGYEMLHYSPFDAAVKRTESTVRETASGRVLRASKGAAGAVASLISGPGADDQLRALHQAADTLAARGMRSLAVARADGAGSDGGAWALCGLLTFVDPPRPDTAETLRRVGAMGVSVKMVTGDAAAIAVETARRLGIGTNIVPSNGLPELVDGKPPPDLDRFAPMIVAADGFAQARGFAGWQHPLRR